MPTQTICPNCGTPVLQGSRQCRTCKMDVSKMAAFAAAKKAAEAKGLGGTVVQGVPLWRQLARPAVIVPLVLAIVITGWILRPKAPPAWTKFPTTQIDAAQALVNHIAVDTYESYDKAYALIPDSARNKELDDEQGLYRQLFLTMNHYLRDEFGADWITRVTFAPEKGTTDIIEAHIDQETLHIRTTLVTPIDKLNDANHHYGVTGISEFDINDASGFQRMGIISGLARAEGGEGAVKNLQTIIGAMGAHRETAMQTKLRVLPNLRDPRMAARRVLLQTWPIRTDPVIRRRLEMIEKDDRYEADVRQTAKDVLHDAVADEDLAAAGVQ